MTPVRTPVRRAADFWTSWTATTSPGRTTWRTTRVRWWQSWRVLYRSNIDQILANRVTMFTDVINISIVWIWHTTIKAFSIPFHRCWFDLFANTVPGWGSLYSVYFLLLDVEEFVFSSWYFLIFYIINSSRGSLPIDVSSLTLEIANGLADKLSVPPSVFIVNNVHKANLW